MLVVWRERAGDVVHEPRLGPCEPVEHAADPEEAEGDAEKRSHGHAEGAGNVDQTLHIGVRVLEVENTLQLHSRLCIVHWDRDSNNENMPVRCSCCGAGGEQAEDFWNVYPYLMT